MHSTVANPDRFFLNSFDPDSVCHIRTGVFFNNKILNVSNFLNHNVSNLFFHGIKKVGDDSMNFHFQVQAYHYFLIKAKIKKIFLYLVSQKCCHRVQTKFFEKKIFIWVSATKSWKSQVRSYDDFLSKGQKLQEGMDSPVFIGLRNFALCELKRNVLNRSNRCFCLQTAQSFSELQSNMYHN